MPAVIILKNSMSKGKSSSLRLLIKLLSANDFVESKISEGFSETGDCFVIMEKDAKTVAVITYGDPGSEESVKRCLAKCRENKVDYIVAASRTKYQDESVYKILWDFVKSNKYQGVETSTIVKYDDWGEEIENEKINKICAENLFNIIEKI